jgi:hypothetical protein
MIPILQFDPSSLTIWYDTHLIARMRGADDIGRALDLALRGEDAILAEHITAIEDEWVRARAATIAAACWHEKRHFIDFILTNYGALRIRQFFTLYLNLPALFQAAQANGELLVPIQSYRERLFCAKRGIKPATSDVMALAGEIRNRKIMLADDRNAIESRFGNFEISGESLLETIAHFIQVSKTERLLGLWYSARIQKDVPDDLILSTRYTWAYRVLINAGLLEPLVAEQDFVQVREHPILPICYAALAQRAWKQQQTRSEAISSFHPSERFGSLVIALRDYREDVRKGEVLDVLEIVNRVSKEIFGRSVIDEMRTDIELEGEFIAKIKRESSERMGLTAYEDYHQLRRRLFKELVDNPSAVLDQSIYADETDKRVRPFVIVAASGGEIGDPPPDYSRVLGYEDPDLGDKRPDGKWWWAASLRELPASQAKNIGFTALNQWTEVVSDLAPAAKLVMDGRNLRTMLGPEIISAESRIQSSLGIKFILDPRHAFPKTHIPTDFWYYITGRDTHRCDLTYEAVHKPEGIVVDPWSLRLRPELFNTLLGSQYGDKTELLLSFWRDWSPWFFSEEFRERWESYKEDPSLVVNYLRGHDGTA